MNNAPAFLNIFQLLWRGCAIEACKRFKEAVDNQVPKVKLEGLVLEEWALKVKGIYRRPLTNEWQIHFNERSGRFYGDFQIRYVPDPEDTDEEHTEEIVELLQSRRSLR